MAFRRGERQRCDLAGVKVNAVVAPTGTVRRVCLIVRATARPEGAALSLVELDGWRRNFDFRLMNRYAPPID
jgi:hypothetical protein